ncbi:MAG TPA: ABC transporter permease [Acidimicrobiales bacterium]|nr:ABC transporter permease [Acidimicrobiales bacterium]
MSVAALTLDDMARPSPSAWKLVRHQVRFDMLSLVRNPQARFFTLAMPLGFLILFCAIFGNGMITGDGLSVHASTYYVANLTAFGIVDVACMSLAVGLVDLREAGILRRRQATPQPSWVIVSSRALTATLTSVVTGVVLLGVGRLAYGASVPIGSVPALAVAVAVGSVMFCCLGFALTGFVRSVQATQPVVMSVTMPLFFISGVFIPWVIIPHWLQHVAVVFPVRHLASALLSPITTHAGASPWNISDLAVLAAWALGSFLVAVRTFSWAPRDL